MKDGKVFVTDYNIHIVLRKMRIDLRKAYQLQEIIAIISKEISENGFTDEDYCLYSHEDMLTPEVVCYLETYPTISSDDKDVYPNFVVMESLELLYYGEQFEDVLMNVQSQIEEPTTDEYISALSFIFMLQEDALLRSRTCPS